MKTNLSRLLREKRKQKRLTLREVAKPLKYDVQFVANWERNASRPPLSKCKKLCYILEIPMGEMRDALYQDYADKVRKFL